MNCTLNVEELPDEAQLHLDDAARVGGMIGRHSCTTIRQDMLVWSESCQGLTVRGASAR